MTPWDYREKGEESLGNLKHFTGINVAVFLHGAREIYDGGGRPIDIVYYVVGWLQENDLI